MSRPLRTALRLGALAVIAAVAVGCAIVTGQQEPAARPTSRPPVTGVTWASGAGTEDRDGFARYRNRPVTVAMTWNDTKTWDDMRGLYTLEDYVTERPARLSFAQPLLAEGDTFASCVSGAHDADFRAVATGLAAKGFGDAFVRLGWEMNGTDYRWQVGQDYAGYIGCFRRAAGIFKQAGPAFAVEWNPTATATASRADLAYPGDDVVDVVGADFYDGWPAAPSAAAFDAKCAARNGPSPVGLCAFADFARAHGKPLSVPEWGIRNQPGAGGGGDNALFVQKMFEFFAEHRDQIAYESYFDLQGGRFELTGGQNPRSAAAYAARWRG